MKKKADRWTDRALWSLQWGALLILPLILFQWLLGVLNLTTLLLTMIVVLLLLNIKWAFEAFGEDAENNATEDD